MNCTNCDKRFKKLKTYENHMKEFHSNNDIDCDKPVKLKKVSVQVKREPKLYVVDIESIQKFSNSKEDPLKQIDINSSESRRRSTRLKKVDYSENKDYNDYSRDNDVYCRQESSSGYVRNRSRKKKLSYDNKEISKINESTTKRGRPTKLSYNNDSFKDGSSDMKNLSTCDPAAKKILRQDSDSSLGSFVMIEGEAVTGSLDEEVDYSHLMVDDAEVLETVEITPLVNDQFLPNTRTKISVVSDQTQTSVQSEEPRKKSKFMFTCFVHNCREQFPHHRDLARHQEDSHFYKCRQCVGTIIFESKLALQRHQKKNHS